MKKYTSFSILGLLGLVCTSLQVQADSTLSLSQAVQEALEKSPQVLRAASQAEEAHDRLKEAFSGFLPKISLNANHLLSYRYQYLTAAFGDFAMVIPSTGLSFDAGLNLFDGFQTSTQTKAAKLSWHAASKESSRIRSKVSHEIRSRYSAVLAAQMLAEVADQNVKTLQDHLKKSQAIVAGGSGTKIDVLRVEVQLFESIPERQQSHDNVILARSALTEAMGLESDARLLSGSLPVPNTSDAIEKLSFDASLRDDLQAAELRAQSAEQQKKAARSIWLPRLGVSAQSQFYNNRDDSFALDRFRNAYTVGVNLSWMLFDYGMISRAKSAEEQQIQAEQLAHAALLRAPVDFDLWKRKYLSSTQLYFARKRAIESAEESVRLARIGYEAGTRTSTEVLDTELDLFRARAGVVRAQVDATEALLQLELASGKSQREE